MVLPRTKTHQFVGQIHFDFEFSLRSIAPKDSPTQIAVMVGWALGFLGEKCPANWIPAWVLNGGLGSWMGLADPGSEYRGQGERGGAKSRLQ